MPISPAGLEYREESSRSRNSAVCIIVMNALQRNEMSPDAVLANDRYEVQVSGGNRNWRTVASGEFEPRSGPQTISFGQPEVVRYLKFIMRSGGGRRAVLADLSVVLAEK